MWKEKTIGWQHDENNIKGFFDEYRYLSNFHECPVMFDGIMYPSSENAYMAGKTTNPELRKQFENITPREAKQLGREIELRPSWDIIKFTIMYKVCFDKFQRNEDLKTLLLETGDKYLEETNWWNDKIWGVCEGEGTNMLGKTLMSVRTNLRLINK